MGLKEYRSKRSFEETPEPKAGMRRRGERLVFVVHKHAARSLHYDLRLEMEGVLKSWAVPKGPSLDPTVKRLAVMVEDHPFDYKDFEGIIPEGNYGAGGVIIWDRGFYRHPSAEDRHEDERLLLQGLQKGDLKFILEGEKLRGEFALVRTKMGEKSWLLLKKKDEYVNGENILRKDRSVMSHRTIEEISLPDSGKPASREKKRRIRLQEVRESGVLDDAPLRPMPHLIKPMLATLIREPFDNPDWIFEVKWDGYRAIAEIRGREVSLYSRNQLALNQKYLQIVDSLRRCGFDAVIDGEIVTVDDQGRPDFQMLQNYGKSGRGHLLYYVFDLLYCEGRDLTNLPLVRRKELLKKILPPSPRLKFSDHVTKDGVLFFGAVREKGLEGMVAKHSQSVYRMGRRSRQWLKVKRQLTQEAVIGGFTEPRRGRKYFGSLVLGIFEGDALVYIGRSGGGFTGKELREIRAKLDALRQTKSPFHVEPESDMTITWVKPKLVCEVAFQGWTEEGLMRQPVFVRIREDKTASQIVRERPLSQ
jgi:bifunctional non-homologous end joining protein LigD